MPFMFIPIVGWVLLLMMASADVPDGAPEGLQLPAVSQAPLNAPVQVCPKAALPHINMLKQHIRVAFEAFTSEAEFFQEVEVRTIKAVI